MLTSMFVLSPNLKYRREWFGCVVLNTANQDTRFFNRSGACLIEYFREPRSSIRPPRLIRSMAARNFLLQAVEDGLIYCIRDKQKTCRAKFFNTHVLEFQRGVFFSPLGMEIEITRRCSRNCSYCAYNSNPKYSTKGELSTNQWKQILRQCSSLGVLFVRFTGGDPLLRADIHELMTFADSLGLVITLGTDLSVFREADALRLTQLRNFYVLQTTLDGPDAVTADRFRGARNFEKVVNAASIVREHNIPFVVGMVVTQQNKMFIRQTAAMAKRLGAAGFVISNLYSAGRGLQLQNSILDERERAEARRDYINALEAENLSSADPGLRARSIASDIFDNDDTWVKQPDILRAADRFMRIDPFGNAYTSIQLRDAIGRSALAGNVLKNKILEIWQESRMLRQLRSIAPLSTVFGPMVELSTATEALTEKKNQESNNEDKEETQDNGKMA